MPTRINPGILYGIAAYAIWGVLPIFLKLLRPMPGADILAHRILWSLALLTIVAAVLRHGAALRAIVRRPKLIAALATSATLVAVNWLFYILAVNGGHIADASLGYFINPLVNVVLGVAVLRERLGRAELVAVLIATAGVIWLTVTQGRLPVTALVLAGSFGLYGLVRKLTPVEAVDGLLIETVLLAPFALAWLLIAAAPLDAASPPWPLLVASGLVTALPLLLFTAAAKRVRYSDLGLLQYLAPSIQLALAVFLYDEPLPPTRLVGFALIWAALVIYAVAASQRFRAASE
ncbi:MAG: EamA family transporter RarD [Pseudomonadota bacterium]